MNTCAKLTKHVGQCVMDHHMIQANDHIMVGLSGGKDSWALLYFLCDLRDRAPIDFKISAVTVDGGLVGLDASELQRQCDALKVPFHLEKQPIFEIVSDKKDPDSTFCSMCAKLRRGVLYRVADQLGCNKIALGHHLDDALETLFLNLFYSGKMAALPPVLKSHKGYADILRPLLYCKEDDLQAFAKEVAFRTVGCACPICPIHPEFDEHSDLKRMKMKKMIREMNKDIPHLHDSARTALKNLELDRFFAFGLGSGKIKNEITALPMQKV